MSNPSQAAHPLVEKTKKKAKHLQSLLKSRVNGITYSECLNYVSRLEGARDWNVLSAQLKQLTPEQDICTKIDDFIINTALPLIVSVALKYNMKVEANAKDIDNYSLFGNLNQSRRINICIFPNDKINNDSFCEPYLEVSNTSLRFYSAGFNFGINFVFPIDAFAVSTQFITSNKILDDMEPQITRCEYHRRTCYILTVNTNAVTDTADHNLDIFTDKNMFNYFQKAVNDLLAKYAKAYKAFSALTGKWGNKRLVEGFENALWKMNHDEPLYMAVSSKFYAINIAALPLHAGVGSTGPYIAGPDGSVEIGACSIIRLTEGNNNKPVGYYIAKYGNDFEARIHLKNFTEEDIDKIIAKFGIPMGHFTESLTSFYQTPAFVALRAWVKSNPKYAKTISQNGEKYLPGWFEMATINSNHQI